jgi:hypothetical protein
MIKYTSTDGNIVVPNEESGLGESIISNTYEDDLGII